ncbi:RNA-binding cell elongation regulator Jag/EloR [Paenibacillus endoradicis]|uniref:RNA-binding cell elongation regulator Jag/EloR n=1 Tax=Paenibacillus endoradicis TaxID=2972487 RepID=UPI002158A757|nr:RNA-binding cell elongation regulator Jag/EloR [Paenibacillus endoradicis]MCR8658473.1 protein jag [Paenibacillus endoradicis]
MTKVLASGKTIDDAVKNGLAQLQVTEDRVKVVIVEQPVKGFLGLIGSKEAKVELELIPDSKEEAEIFIRDVAKAMGLDVQLTWQESKDGIQLSIACDGDIGMIIGKRGQTLDALQYLVTIVANRYSDNHIRIVLDAQNFREGRRKRLESLSDRLAGTVIRTRKEIVLEPMVPHERKIIHSHLQSHAKVRTFSKGDEPNRRIVIALK